MSSTNRSDVRDVASEVLTPPAEEARTCSDRQRRLTEYIRGHTGANVAVRLTPFVRTACVIPTSREKLVDSDNADFSPEEAQRVVNSVDADFLVLISTDPATVERLPFSDQLTADRSQQYGYALHELGHIRYTAIATCASMVRDRVEESHQGFVKGIWNSVEDTAIENQLTIDQSQLAADRLEIVNRSISKPADEFPPERTVTFSFRDSIERALYDRGIYDTGIDERLCDTENEQFVFESEADQQAFTIVDDSIDTLLGTILTTPSSVQRAEAVLDWWEDELEPLLSPPDQDERDNQQQEPEMQDEGSSQDSAQQQSAEDNGEPSTDQQGQGDDSQQAPHGEPDGDQDEGAEEPEQRPDPSEINTEQRQESHGSDTLEYPDIGSEEDADALTHPEEDEAEGSDTEDEHDGSEGDVGDNEDTGGEEESKSTSNGDSEDSQDFDSGSDADGEPSNDTNTSSENESESTPEPGREQIGGAGEPEDSDSEGEAGAEGSEPPSKDRDSADESGSGPTDGDAGDSPSDNPDSSENGENESNRDTGGGEEASGDTSPDSSASNPWMDASDDAQTQSSLGSFGESADQSPTDSEQSFTESENTGSTADSSSTNNTEGEGEGETGATSSDDNTEEGDADDSEPEKSRPDEAGEDGEGGHGEQNDDTQEDEEPAPPDPSPAHEGSDLENSDALDTDREGAHNEAESSTPDGASLERDLEDAGKALENLNEEEEAEGEDGEDDDADGGSQDTGQAKDGSGATPGSLDELSIMPSPDSGVADSLISERFDDADRDADYTAGALRKALKNNQQSGSRTGLTSGTFDRRRAGDLARGQLNVFQVNQQGEEKEYDLILILDRSISMRNAVGTAEDAMVRFAIACEDIGINVGILDFYEDQARLIKPFSVETQFVQSSLLSGDRGGATPLADALSIGNELLEQRWNSPLVLVVTDGKPGDSDAYQDVLSTTYAPVCGLTLCLGHSRDTIPERISQNEQFYDRHMYVFDADKITNRLQQFATMFAGL